MNAKSLIGVDLGGTNVRAGRIADGALVTHAAAAISARGGDAQKVLDEIYATIDRVFDRSVAGIGVGVPSVVDVDRGIVFRPQNIPCWENVPLKDLLESRYEVPAYVNNDANCFALGEFYFGQGRGCRHMIGLIIGTGLGAGVIVNGHLYSGANCGAGEIGTIPYKDHTVEYYASGSAFRDVHGVAGGGDELFKQASRGDAEALAIFAQFGHEVGHAIEIALYAYDPEVILLGGSVPKAMKFWEGAMRKKLEAYAYPHALKRTKIVASEIPEVAVLGAAGLVLDAVV